MPRVQAIKLHFGTFDFEAECIIGPFEPALRLISRKMEWPNLLHELDEERQSENGRYFSRKDFAPRIWLPRKPRSVREHGTLAHEVGHLVRDLMGWAGIELNYDTDEVYCHAIGYAVRTILGSAR